MRRISVLTINPKLGALDYVAPDGVELVIGSIVSVPLGARMTTGVVWDAPEALAPIDSDKLREVGEPHPLPPIDAPLRKLIHWTADYYVVPAGAVLRMALANGAVLDVAPLGTQYRVSETPPDGLTPKRRQAYDKLMGTQGGVSALALEAQVSPTIIRGLIAAGGLVKSARVTSPRAQADPDHHQPNLSSEQAAAAETLRAMVEGHRFAPVLLNGVTGSGKTEVYFEAIAAALHQSQQTLLLLPEIALTEPFLARFVARFGAPPLIWHSNLTPAARRDAFHAIITGAAQVVVGTRSALFLPFARLGLIIVDEAHEASFKQDDGVPYHARDVAIMRASFESIPAILATATPALETQMQVNLGHYTEIQLPDRFGGARLPDIRAVDLNTHPPERGRWLSPLLIDALASTLARGEQSLLFLNRRGYAPLTLCRTCGHRFQCPDCSAWMVEHRTIRRLQCHHCGLAMPPPRACPECGDTESLVACGPGVERIADEVGLLFPDARRAVATSDTLSTAPKIAAFVTAMQAGEIDVVIGTQLVTKGYHFPHLTLVGVVDADLGLEGGDLRAAERSFQQISQAGGRAGRAEKPGQVLVQTREPRAPVIAALLSGDSARFYQTEMNARQTAGAPPFGRYVALIVSGRDRSEAEHFARDLARAAPPAAQVHVYGPAPAPLALLRGWHRFRLLVHAPRTINVQGYLRNWLSLVPQPRAIRLRVDVDPYNFN